MKPQSPIVLLRMWLPATHCLFRYLKLWPTIAAHHQRIASQTLVVSVKTTQHITENQIQMW
jgi:hypothetical protein